MADTQTSTLAVRRYFVALARQQIGCHYLWGAAGASPDYSRPSLSRRFLCVRFLWGGQGGGLGLLWAQRPLSPGELLAGEAAWGGGESRVRWPAEGRYRTLARLA
jgi:hypothetical protein